MLSNGTPESSSLQLDALRYLLDEMGPQERVQFEQLLAEGGAACDALVDAVLIQESAKTLSDSRYVALGTTRRPPVRRLRAPAVAAAVLVVLAVASVLLRQTPSPAPRPAGSPPLAHKNRPSPEQLMTVAEVWTLLGTEDGGFVAADTETVADFDEAAGSLSHVHVPDWMLAAVGAKSDEPTDSEPLKDLEDEEQL